MEGLRIVPRRRNCPDESRAFVRYNLKLNFITAPLIADLFLLAILAIGRQEVHDGIIGANNIAPYDIMLFFVSLAYIAISIDTSGLIRYMAYKVLQWGGEAGYRLYFYLYCFFFLLTAGIGNDPVILSGSPFLAYMTRVSANISHPRAWIFSQFAVANIASAILVSSNPTNLVIAGAFGIRFINYSANIIVPVIVTGVVLFPCLLYGIFRDEKLIPKRIEMHQLSEEAREEKPVNPNIPIARVGHNDEIAEKRLPLEEIMNPYIDKVGAWFAASILALTLVTLLIVNAVLQGSHELHAFWVTLPAAILTLSFDLIWGWMNRHETRRVAQGRTQDDRDMFRQEVDPTTAVSNIEENSVPSAESVTHAGVTDEKPAEENAVHPSNHLSHAREEPATLVSCMSRWWRWFHTTFPTAATVLAHLPLALVLFAFCMFILVQALVTKGWVPVFAHGWDAWVNKTGTVGAIGGMGFIGVILCNVCAGSSVLNFRIIYLHCGSSLLAQILGRVSSLLASFKHGRASTSSMEPQSPIAHFGERSIVLLSLSTMALSASPSAPHLLACCGAISLGRNTSMFGVSISSDTTFQSSQ